jgi:uncharacterized phage infection (PIP) family protein YhgE
MALFEAVANVVTRYKADVADNIKGLQKLKGEERARAEALLEQHRKTNEALENQIKGFQKVAAGVVLMAAGFAAATKGLDAYAKTSDEAKEKVEKLKETTSKAFDTLYAGIGQTVMAFEPLISGVASLVQLMSDLHIAGPAAVAAIGFAITKNPKVAALLAAVSIASDAVSSLTVDEKTQGRNLELMRAGATVYGGGDKPEAQALIKKYEIEDALEAKKKVDAVNDALGLSRGPFDQLAKTFSRFNASLGARVAAIAESALGVDPWSGPVKFDKATDKVKVKEKEGPFRSYVGAISTDYQFGGEGSTTLGSAADSVPRDEFGREILPDVNAPYQKLVDAEKSRQATVLERMFGPLEEFDAYAESFGMLAGAATSAYDALVEGNMSAGDAMKAFLKDAIKGLGSRMLIRALEETAEGVASLASPLTAAAAPAHFKAAGLFAAGAVTAGLVASRMGGGGGGGGGGSASASLPRDMGTGRDQYDGGKSNVIIIGDPMADDSPRYKARNVDRMLNMAVRTSAGRYA